jgi:hypothetical protein
VYHAGVYGKLQAEKIMCMRGHMHARCISFYYLDDRTKWALRYFIKHGIRIFCDSGAFTLQKQRLSEQAFEIYVDKYADFLHQHKQHFDFYAPVDYERNASAVERAMRALHQRGLYPAPVFHGNNDFRELVRLLDQGYPLVLIAQPESLKGKGTKAGEELRRHYAQCFELAARYGAALHGLSETGECSLQFPWASVDSTSWNMGSKRGELFFSEGKKFSQFYFGNTREGRWDWLLPEVREKVLPLCDRWGFTLHELIRDGQMRACFNACLLSHVIESPTKVLNFGSCNESTLGGSALIPTTRVEKSGGAPLNESRIRRLLKLAKVWKGFSREIAQSAILLYATFLRHRARYARVHPDEKGLLKELFWFRKQYCNSIPARVVRVQMLRSRKYMGWLKDETIYKWLGVDEQEIKMLDAVRFRKPKKHKEQNQRQLKAKRLKLVVEHLRERSGATIAEVHAHLVDQGEKVSRKTVARYLLSVRRGK